MQKVARYADRTIVRQYDETGISETGSVVFYYDAPPAVYGRIDLDAAKVASRRFTRI